MSDEIELNEILKEVVSNELNELNKKSRGHQLRSVGEESPNVVTTGGYVQWSSSDGKMFIPSSKTQDKLTPGVYEIMSSPNIGIYFEKIPVLTTGLLRFPETNSESVVEEIQKFWKKEHLFKQYKLTHKRGIILWGPPGSGKSCTIQLIMRDVVEREGVVIKFTQPWLFCEGIRKFREIQPDTPVVVLMEDIDSILEVFNESEVLNILDGVNQIDKAVFLATTNYPEKLGARIINRPSRFDKRFKIGHPNAESRRIYFEYILGPKNVDNFNVKQWVKDTKDFSIAHLKELFTAVVILGDSYESALKSLRLMREAKPDSSEDEQKRKMGFNTQNDGYPEDGAFSVHQR